MLGYQPINAAAEASLPPTGMPPEAMLSDPQFQQLAMQPEPPPLAKRLPASRLVEMYNAWEQAKTGEIAEAYMASRYYHAHQWTDAELKVLKKRKQPPAINNRIKRKVDFLVGVEQGQRRDPKGLPRVPQGEKAAFVGTACLRYVQDDTNFPAIASDVMNDALVRGIGIVCTRIEKVKGKAEIRKHRVPSDRFFYDPRSELWDFADALYLGEQQWMDIDQAKEMLPWAVETIDQLASSAGGQGGVIPQLFDKEKNWIDTKQRRIFLISIWYKYEGNWLFDFLVGPVSLCPEDMDCLSPYIDEDEQTVHQYEAWSPYVDERGDRYGVVRDMIPIQDSINKRESKMLHMLTVRQTKSETGAVDDIDAMKAELAKPDGHVVYNKGFEFDVIDNKAQLQGQFELLQESKANIENLGPNPGLVGRGVEKQSGRAILAQQNSGMTELSPVFERGREWKFKCYRRDWNLTKQFWTDERRIRVTGNPKAPEFLNINCIVVDPMTGQRRVENAIAEVDIDIILDEGPDTVTMREELLQILSNLGPGAVPPELLIELSNISEKDEILQKLQEFKAPPPEMMDLQKRMADLELLLKAAEVDKAVADVESSRAGAGKTMVEAGLPPEVLSGAFPFYWREPTYLEQTRGLMGGQGGQMPQMTPQNALAGPPDAMGGQMPPEGMGMPNELGEPPQGQEPTDGDDYLAQSSTPWVQPNGLEQPVAA